MTKKFEEKPQAASRRASDEPDRGGERVQEQPKIRTLPETGFLRLRQILGDPNATPPIPPIIPVRKTAWWSGIKSGRFPQPVKLGPRTTAWRVEDIRRLIEKIGGEP